MISCTWFVRILHMVSIMSPICCATHALHTTVHMLFIMCTYASLHMVWMNSPHGWRGFSTSCCVFFLMLFSTWFAWNSPHVQIMFPYAFFHTICIAFSTCSKSFLHMLCSTWFARIVHILYMCSPHHLKYLYWCFSPYSYDAFSTCFNSCLHMLPSTR